MAKQLPRYLEVPLLRVRSITAGMDNLPNASTGQKLTFTVGEDYGSGDRALTIQRQGDAGRPYREVQVSLASVLALAAMESDSPARAPIREKPPRLTAPAPIESRKLVGMLAAVMDIMKGGQWWTLRELQQALKDRGRFHELPAISARIRDMRKPEFGSRQVEREKDPKVDGLFRYRLLARQ